MLNNWRTAPQAMFNGLAQFHQARMCHENKLVGEEIAR
jgi:hypothetical protein